MAEEDIPALIAQLQSHDYGARFVALGKLIERGEAAVPLLTEALYHPDKPLRVRAACALAGIGAAEATVILPVADLWEESPSENAAGEALVVLVTKLAAGVHSEDIPVLLRLLRCHKKAGFSVNGSSTLQISSEGVEVSRIAAAALETLAKRSPTYSLRQAIPLLKYPFLAPPTIHQELTRARKAIELATKQWEFFPPQGDLPVPAESPEKVESK